MFMPYINNQGKQKNTNRYLNPLNSLAIAFKNNSNNSWHISYFLKEKKRKKKRKKENKYKRGFALLIDFVKWLYQLIREY